MDWKIVALTFASLFVAELGDKTQLAVITLTCKHQRPLPIFLGATAALAAVTAVGVFGGQTIARVVQPDVMRRIAAALFVLLGVLMWFDVL